MSEYYKQNREVILAWRREYNRKKSLELKSAKQAEALLYEKHFPKLVKVKKVGNPLSAKVAANMRRRVNQALKHQGTIKSNHTMDYVGCSKEELVKHIESKFKGGMSWDNYGLKGWHIDHIIPLCSYDLTIDKNRYTAFHYTNLQPLWAKDNLKKGSVIPRC